MISNLGEMLTVLIYESNVIFERILLFLDFLQNVKFSYILNFSPVKHFQCFDSKFFSQTNHYLRNIFAYFTIICIYFRK